MIPWSRLENLISFPSLPFPPALIGKWIPKEFNMGRHIAGTGIWDCCGAIKQFSMYCTSAAARLSVAEQKILKDKEEQIAKLYKERIVREFKQPWEKGM